MLTLASMPELSGDTSSLHDREFAASRGWRPEREVFDVGKVTAWIFSTEKRGGQAKSQGSGRGACRATISQDLWRSA